MLMMCDKFFNRCCPMSEKRPKPAVYSRLPPILGYQPIFLTIALVRTYDKMEINHTPVARRHVVGASCGHRAEMRADLADITRY